MSEHLRAALMGWAKLAPQIGVDTVSPSFTFESCARVLNREEFLDRGSYGEYRKLSIRDVIEVTRDSGALVAILFEYTDSVTLLEHRTAWFAGYVDGLLVRIVATSGELASSC